MQPIDHPDKFDPSWIDAATALVLLFHDHEWEPLILIRALPKSPFYVGALGSHATHARRLQKLEEAGVSVHDRAKVHGPVGKSIGAEGPSEIDVSILADLIDARRRAGLPPL